MSETHVPCCENTDAEAINFCHLLARVGDKYLQSAFLPSVSLTANGDDLGSLLSGFAATETWRMKFILMSTTVNTVFNLK